MVLSGQPSFRHGRYTAEVDALFKFFQLRNTADTEAVSSALTVASHVGRRMGMSEDDFVELARMAFKAQKSRRRSSRC